MVSITGLAHELVRSALRPGDWAVDGTAGNGHDTLFLAQQVGSTGMVWAFDIQTAALESTRRRLDSSGCRNGQLLLASHAELEQHVPPYIRGSVSAVMFNLGYLPFQDHQLTTLRETTLPAIAGAMRLLRVGGVLSVVAYRGHPGGEEEASAVDDWMQAYAAESGGPFRFPRERPQRGPQLLALKKL